MTGIALVRVDDRLIHGQVVVKWLRHVRCSEIVIVDDALARDAFMQRVFRLAAPPDLPLFTLSIGDAIPHLTALEGQDGGALVLLKAPRTALALREGGVPIQELNLGGIGWKPGARRLFKSVAVTPDDIAALERLCAAGVHIYYQMVPEERPVPIQCPSMR